MSSASFSQTESPFNVLVLVTRKPGTTFEQFRHYYENHHVPLIIRLLGGANCFQSYTRHFVDRQAEGTFPFGGEDNVTFDCIAQTEYVNRAAYEGTLKTFTEHIQEINEDEEKFLDRSKTVFIIPGVGPVNKAVNS